MRISNTLGVLKRRWYLVLLGLALTTAGCLVLLSQIPVSYQAKGSLVLMPPSATVGEEGNPYLYLGGMDQALDVLVRQVNAEEVTEPVLDGHPDTEYTIEPDGNSSGPILRVNAIGTTPKAAMDTLYAALGTVPVSLNAMQDELSIQEHLRIGLKTIVVDAEPTKDDDQRVQLTIFAAAMGIAGTVLLTGLIDGYLLSSRRKEEETHNQPAPQTARPSARETTARPRRPVRTGEDGDGLRDPAFADLDVDGDPSPRVGATRS